MTRRLWLSALLSLVFASLLTPALDADGGKAKNVIYQARVPARAEPSSRTDSRVTISCLLLG